MKYFSSKSRQYTGDEDPFTDPKRERLVQFAENHLVGKDIDYYVFGHRHLPVDYKLSNKSSRYINLGEWMFASSYAEFDGNKMMVKFFESEIDHVFGNQSLNQ
jgi:UDP-2,3-diacylglucosamine hydrolase